MRKLIFNLHLFIAVTAGAFMVILGVTGSIMAFEPELDRSFHYRLSHVTPRERVLSLTEIGNAVSRQCNGEPVVAYLPSLWPDLSWQVVLPRGVAYVNQYSGEVLGLRARGQTFLGYARALHLRLGGGDLGRNILKWSGVEMLLSLVSGFYLWWPVKRLRIQGSWRTRRFWFDLHNAVGIFTVFPLIMLAATGTIMGFEDRMAPLISKLTRSHPLEVDRAPTKAAKPGATPITPDQAVAAALRQMPGAVPYRVQMPAYGGTYQVALLDSRDRISGDRNVVALDPFGNVVSVTRSRDFSRGERILAVNEAIHTGNIFGIPSRIAVCLASAMVLVQAASGLLMWLYRNRFLARQSTGQGSP